MRRARALAQAKINVWLHVLHQRRDGFHEILTSFQRIDLADEVTVRATDSGSRSLDVTGPHVPTAGLGPVEQNLAYRAAVAFQGRVGWPGGFEIALTKHIPVGGGLGGGSADAGAVLRALNTLAPEPLTAQELHALAEPLGADVAFLASQHPSAIGSGRGEILIPPTAEMPVADVLLVVPPFAIATVEAYGWLRTTGRYMSRDVGAATTGFAEDRSWASQDRGNTFESVVEERFPTIRTIREQLQAAGATIARLSGSGSTVFGLFDGHAIPPRDLGVDALVIPTRTAKKVVPVEVLE
ncbi:MAG TPA: 4-(cytidine 5'-diphospho)-2-C-methyl-D-erythritol kinase [Gemmatimonadaceae bacterium]|nr:4-(cytidine 5'-diphospho)-2-C-methyl-D-erythritol kinase [Gemmatimonadaceae bacterium]